MKFENEVSEFKKVNGNASYTERDMLMFLCNKIEKVDDKQNNIDKRVISGDGNYKWVRVIGSAYFAFFAAIIYLILNLHSIIG